MKQLVLLYWGCVFLMYLSQTYYPVETQLDGPQTGKRHFMLRRADIFMIVVIAWMTCFSFLRESYNDTASYISDFMYLSDPLDRFLKNNNLLEVGSNSLFQLYMSVVHNFTSNYHIFFFFPAIISSFVSVKFFKRYSANIAFSLLIFYSIGTYVMYIAAMKQSIAVGFLLLALPYAIDKKYIKYYILVFIAMLFHTHAFVFLVVPLFFGKPWGKVTWFLLAAVLISMATYDVTFGALMNTALSMGISIVDWELFDGHSINLIRVVVYWIPALLALFLRNRLFSDSTRTENLFANLSIGAAFVITIGLRQGANLFARMAAYYEIAVGITLPWMINKLFTKQSAQLVSIAAIVLYFVYFLYEFGVSKNFGADYSAITLWQFLQSLFS